MNVFDVLREKLEELEKIFGTNEIDPDCAGRGLCKSEECLECVLINVIEIINWVEETYSESDNTDYAVSELYAFWEKWHGKVENNGWIPSEEPPKDDKYILLSFSNFPVPCAGRYEEDDEGGAYYLGDEDVSLVSQGMIVNAWQPLPEPYRGEDYSGIQTNADRIRAMGDEGLAELFFALGADDCEKIPFCRKSTRCEEIMDKGELVPHELCKQCMVDWLKKEVEE